MSKAFARRPRVIVTLCLVAFLGWLGWYGWRWYTAPTPPDVARDGASPELVEAVQAARQQVLRQPRSVAAWGRLGKLLRASDYFPEARACFARAEQLDPVDPRWPYLLGEAWLQTGDTDAAVPCLRRAVSRSGGGPETVTARLRLAEVLLAQGAYDEAETLLRRALEDDPESPVLHLNLGLLADARGEGEVSRQHLLRCRESPLTRKRAAARLAALARQQGDVAAADEFSRQAAALPADRAWTDPYVLECQQLAVGKADQYRRVEQLEAAGRYREAVAQLRAFLDRGPDYLAYVGLGRNLMHLGDFTGAEQALQAAVRLDPDKVQAHYFLSKVCWARAEQQWRREGERSQALEGYRQAAEHARQAIARKSDYTVAHLVLGLSLRRLGQRAEAAAALRTAIACSPDFTDPYLYLGEALAEDGQAAEARALLEQAQRLAKPDDRRPREALARLAAKGG